MNENILKKSIRAAIKQVLIEQSSETQAQPKSEDSNTPAASTSNPNKKEKSPTSGKPGARDKDTKKKRKKKTKKRAAAGSIGIATGAVGSGRFSNVTMSAGSRAQKDPAGLMKDLGIKGAAGGSDLDQVLAIINAAIHSNDVMGEAYTGANLTKEQTANGNIISVVGISPGGINNRNAIKFLSHTLIGAQNAGMLSLVGAVEINQGRNAPIVVYAA
jgi:hypothetical protein